MKNSKLLIVLLVGILSAMTEDQHAANIGDVLTIPVSGISGQLAPVECKMDETLEDVREKIAQKNELEPMLIDLIFGTYKAKPEDYSLTLHQIHSQGFDILKILVLQNPEDGPAEIEQYFRKYYPDCPVKIEKEYGLILIRLMRGGKIRIAEWASPKTKARFIRALF